jgi:hypothetical protein
MTILFEGEISRFQENYGRSLPTDLSSQPGVVMGLWPIQDGEKRLGPVTALDESAPFPLSSRAKLRDLQFRGPLLERCNSTSHKFVISTGAQRSGEICGLNRP